MPKKTRVRSTILTRFISIFVVITTPFLCLSLLSSWRNESLLHERILQDVERSTAAFAQKMELNYSHIFSIQQSLVLDSDLVDLVRRGDKMTRFGWTQSVNRLKDKLRDYMTVSPYIKEMSLYLISMEQVISGPYGSRNSYDNFNEAVRQRLDMLLETEGTALLDNNELVIFTVHHTGGRPDYVVETVVPAEQLLTGPNLMSENSGHFLLQKGSGQIVALPGEKELARALSDARKTAREGETLRIEDAEYLVVEQDFTFSDIKLVSYIDEKTQLRPLNLYRGWFFAAIGLFLGLTLLYAQVMKIYVSHPVSVLIEHFKLLEKGEMNSHIQEERRDEFGVLFSQFNRTLDQLNSAILDSLKQTIYLQKAELRQLQAQINPHFLYNSYFLLHRLIKKEDPYALEFSRFLGEYFKYISTSPQEETLFLDEHEHARVYANIQGIRFRDRVRIEFAQCPPELANFRVPSLILQPILENAFKYGLENRDGMGLLSVEYACEPEAFFVRIHNNGVPMDEQTLQGLREAFDSDSVPAGNSALINIHRRLRLTFGRDSGISIENKEDGVTIQMRLQREASV